MKSNPIVVAGAGPTGALLGIELARHGADVRIIEKNPAPPIESRAGSVHSRTLELFARLGIADDLMSVGNRVGAMNFYSNMKSVLRVDFRDLDGPYPFMLHVPQFETQRVLDRRLHELGVEVQRGVELVRLTPQRDVVNVTTQSHDGVRNDGPASFVVGCDGAHSRVRHELDMSFDGEQYGWDWFGADVELDWAYPESESHVFTSPRGVFVCLPYGGGRWRLITTLENASELGDAGPNLQHLRELAALRGPAMGIDNATWLGLFRVSRRSAPHYRRGRVFLAGDAAHIHSPAAGQGMNAGLGDAANLGWKLALVATGRGPESLLDTYGAERAPVAQGIIAMTHRLMSVFRATGSRAVVRDVVLPAVTRRRRVERRIATRISQQAISYRNSPLVVSQPESRSRRAPVCAGDRAPQVTGLRLGQEVTSLFDLIARPEHTVFVVDAAVRGDASRVVSKVAGYADLVSVFQVRDGGAGAEGELVVVDSAGEFRRRYGLRAGWALAVRPDGYVGYVGRADGLHEYLNLCLLADTEAKPPAVAERPRELVAAGEER